MNKRRAWIYECEHCGKSGRSGGHISTHEKHCTMNPQRVCRVCLMDRGDLCQGEGEQKPIAELLPLLPDPKSLSLDFAKVEFLDDESDTFPQDCQAVGDGIERLREARRTAQPASWRRCASEESRPCTGGDSTSNRKWAKSGRRSNNANAEAVPYQY